MIKVMTPSEVSIITLDGPAASGKSTVARAVASQLGIPYVSSGLLYRAATYLALERGADARREEELLRLLEEHRLDLEPGVEGNRVYLDDREVTVALQTDRVDATVSLVAAHPRLREWVTAQLRRLPGPFVVEGRDMGSVVFPGAGNKFYLTAPAAVRAERRAGERSADPKSVTEALRKRDSLDARQLEPARDAVCIDTSGLTLEQVVQQVLSRLEEAGLS